MSQQPGRAENRADYGNHSHCGDSSAADGPRLNWPPARLDHGARGTPLVVDWSIGSGVRQAEGCTTQVDGR
jgi:hypothetical protein